MELIMRTFTKFSFIGCIFVGSIIGCELVQPVEVVPDQPGAALVTASKNADAEDVLGAIGIVAPAVFGPWGLVLAAFARAAYTKRAAGIAIRSNQPNVDNLTNKQKAELDESQTPAAKRIIRQARGKSFNLPI